MESTFKRQYEKETLPDGAVKLTYKGSRVGSHHASAMMAVIGVYLFIAFWAWIFITLGVTLVLGSKNFGLSCLVGFAILVVVVYKLNKKLFIKTTTLVVRPDGIIFEQRGKTIFGGGEARLAFRDIADFGITTETSSGNGRYSESSYVYANAGGQKIPVTCHIKGALAEALLAEIHQVAV